MGAAIGSTMFSRMLSTSIITVILVPRLTTIPFEIAETLSQLVLANHVGLIPHHFYLHGNKIQSLASTREQPTSYVLYSCHSLNFDIIPLIFNDPYF